MAAIILRLIDSKFMRSISSPWKYLQCKQISQQNREQEALSGKEEEETVIALSYQNSTEADFLWKHVLLLATLAASVTYLAALSPLGSLWFLNGDPVHKEAFLYCNVTVFFASNVIIILVLVHSLSCHRRWLRALEAEPDKFGFMGAYAISKKSALRAQDDSGKSVKPEAAETVVERGRKRVLILAILVTAVTTYYQAGMSPPGGFWQSDIQDDDGFAGDPKLRGPHTYRSVALSNATAVMACLAAVMSTTMTRHGFRSCAPALVVLMMGAFAIWSSGIVKTSSIYVNALVATVLLYGLQVLVSLCNPVDNWLRNVLAVKESLGLGRIGAYAAGNCSKSDPAAVEDDPIIRRWHVACDAVHHMTGNLSLLQAGGFSSVYDGNNGEDIFVHPANRELPLRVRGSGSVRTESIALDDVWYVPGLDSNMVSTGQLARQGCAITLGPGGCRITKGDALVGSARFTDDYQFELDFLKVASSK